MARWISALAAAAVVSIFATAVPAETPDEWIALGARVHGGFGAFIPVGIRIGLDALQRLGAKPHDVMVIYHDSETAPCACVADGIAIATTASVGQRTLRMASYPAPAGTMAMVIVRRKDGGPVLTYRVSARWLPRIAEWNRTLDPRGRYDAVMQAEGLFDVTEMP